MKKLLITFTVLSFLGACAPTDNKKNDLTMDAKVSSLTAETSKKTDVYSILGQPDDVKNNSNGTVWIYYRLFLKNAATTYVPIFNLVAGGNNVTTKVTTIFFDERGRYKNKLDASSNTYANMWGIGSGGIGPGGLTEDEQAVLRVKAEMEKIGEAFDNDHKISVNGS